MSDLSSEAKKLKQEYFRKYREKNREKINAYRREYYKANSKRVNSYNDRYWENKAESLREEEISEEQSPAIKPLSI